jgi:hypothetical protein
MLARLQLTDKVWETTKLGETDALPSISSVRVKHPEHGSRSLAPLVFCSSVPSALEQVGKAKRSRKLKRIISVERIVRESSHVRTSQIDEYQRYIETFVVSDYVPPPVIWRKRGFDNGPAAYLHY